MLQEARRVGKKVALLTQKVGYFNVVVGALIFVIAPGGVVLSPMWITYTALRRAKKHTLLTASSKPATRTTR